MFKFQMLFSLLLLCCKAEPGYSNPLQFLLVNVRSIRAAGPVFNIVHAVPCTVPDTWETLNKYLCNEGNTKKATNLGPQMGRGSGEQKTEQIKVK